MIWSYIDIQWCDLVLCELGDTNKRTIYLSVLVLYLTLVHVTTIHVLLKGLSLEGLLKCSEQSQPQYQNLSPLSLFYPHIRYVATKHNTVAGLGTVSAGSGPDEEEGYMSNWTFMSYSPVSPSQIHWAPPPHYKPRFPTKLTQKLMKPMGLEEEWWSRRDTNDGPGQVTWTTPR